MRKILFVIPNSGPGGVPNQVALLAGGLARDRFRVRVCTLHNSESVPDEFLHAVDDVESLRWGRAFDARPPWRLRQIAREFQPDIIHSWKSSAFRAVALATVRLGGRRIVSQPLVAAERGLKVNALDRWLVKRADRVVAGSSFEEAECRRIGIRPDRCVRIAPGVLSPPSVATAQYEVRHSLGLPDHARWLACAGPLEEQKGFRDAIWALAMLQHLFPDLHLVIAGAGTALDSLRHFLNIIESKTASKVHFTGVRSDLTMILGHAEIVWVPSRADVGQCVALEAMALGRPVVASRVGSLSEIVVDGTTGVLVHPGDSAALALQTRLLLDNPEQARSLGQAGRQRALAHFSVAEFIANHERLYESTEP